MGQPDAMTDKDRFSYRACINHVSQAWEDFVVGFSSQHQIDPACLVFNETLATFAIGNAIVDLERMALFHIRPEKSIPDKHKYAGFLAKWITKVKPVRYDDKLSTSGIEEPISGDAHIIINAHFALYIFRSTLEYSIPKSIQDHLLYAFEYRDWSGENLALLAYSCEETTRLQDELNNK